MHSDSQLTRILTLALILGGILFIFSAQIAHLKSEQDLTSNETIYIQADEEVVATQDNELTEDYAEIISNEEEIISNELDIAQINGDTSSEQNWADTSINNTNFQQALDFEHVALLITNMNTNERERVLSDQELFKQVIESEANNRSAVMAAANNKLNQHPNVKFMMQRNSENMLLEFYLNLLVKKNLPEEFPSTEQVVAFYEANKEKQFTFPLRVRVWQIFLSKPENATEEEILEIQKNAEEIISKIKTGINDFTNIAVSKSQHELSRNRGGYMGVMEVDGLLPEIKEYILKSKIGEISEPIETDTGLHILKRGLILAEETLPFEQVEDQIRQTLIKQTGTQLKNTIFQQAREDYPQKISENIVQEWWLKLKDESEP